MLHHNCKGGNDVIKNLENTHTKKSKVEESGCDKTGRLLYYISV